MTFLLADYALKILNHKLGEILAMFATLKNQKNWENLFALETNWKSFVEIKTASSHKLNYFFQISKLIYDNAYKNKQIAIMAAKKN